MHIEREIKLALARASEPALSRLAPARRSVTSIYYDTPTQELRSAGIALRLRRDGRRWLQTLKAEGAPHAGLAARAEWELPVRGSALEPGAFPHREILAATGLDLARVAPRLRPVFETRFIRRSGVVRLDGAASAELAIDRGGIVAGSRREPIREVEIELISGTPDALLRYAEALELPLAYESKAERGYRLAAGLSPAPRRWRMPSLAPSAPAAQAFAALCSAALTQAGTNAAAMLGSADPEYLHQLRVGLRRLRSALHAFGPILQARARVRRPLRRLAQPLGSARDLDVFVQTLQDAHAAAPLLRRAQSMRACARRAARSTVGSTEFQRFLFRSLRWLQSEPWLHERTTLEQLAPARLERLYRKALAAFRWKNPRQRHALRIRIKRLRHACEFFAPCFPEGRARAFVRELSALQDMLGELNDLAVARRLLRALKAAAPTRLAAREARLMSALRAAGRRFQQRQPYWRRPG